MQATTRKLTEAQMSTLSFVARETSAPCAPDYVQVAHSAAPLSVVRSLVRLGLLWTKQHTVRGGQYNMTMRAKDQTSHVAGLTDAGRAALSA